MLALTNISKYQDIWEGPFGNSWMTRKIHLSLPASMEDDLALILPFLTASFIDLLIDLVHSCADLLLPEAASINSLIVSGLTRKEKLSPTGLLSV